MAEKTLYDDSSGPARGAVAIVPHDSNAQPASRAIYVGTGGNITLRGVDGSADVVLKNVPSGTLIPFRAGFIRATGTTAADMVALS